MLFSFVFSSQIEAQGFAPGASLAFGTETNSLGFNGRTYFFVNNKLCFGPEFTWFLPKVTETSSGKELDGVWEINLNAHYLFEIGSSFSVYPLGGFNYSTTWNKDDTGLKTSESAFGLNAGGGVHYHWEKLMPYFEYDFLWGERGNHSFILGTFWHFGK